jgi:Ulp1 family protease
VQSTAFESTLPKVKSLSCFFSPSLLRAHKNGNWEVVMKTGQRLNLSAIDYLLIPINQNNVHWTLALARPCDFTTVQVEMGEKFSN